MIGRVGVRCDAGAGRGVGHLVRCVALAEELRGRGVEVSFLGDLAGSAWARAQLLARGLPLVPAPDGPGRLAELVGDLRLDAVVLDSYDLAPGTGARVRQTGAAVLAIVDGDPLGQEADVYLDQNLGAELRPFPLLAERLAGVRYALLRDSVRGLRRVAGPRGDVPRVLCFFGGTDSAGVTPAWAEALGATGMPFRATVVSPRPFAADGPITVIPPTDRLPELMAEADLVLTAAGSTIWELLYLGVPAALTWVTGNQLIGYEALVGGGIAAGLGPAPGPAATEMLARLLADPGLREEYGRRGSGLVDGKGRERVADALLGLR
ncbi:PseG/SpsG family protein [Nonomuraea roseoviolacea]|uniref:Spore coat polysaccharide biosynthesis predicted glycosyltransferase SpsG n=1 Tax=Nonomuraea roseoviolacea subsp. carminata TaxID=160689 RepID=A0ABT1JWJ3_9ACTN|nr:glycosyltransferase [Nonomuraea roseoviolacea]MCP2346121.1 spore coat polysaccharide biosynthesis predicted glycosyltransferase SpsG [Nonomuraea roseoviolacea subsp. carminata]